MDAIGGALQVGDSFQAYLPMSTSAKRWLDAVGFHFGIFDWKLSNVMISTEAAISAIMMRR